MLDILTKATGMWLVIVVAAIFNGVFREKVLVPLIGENLALPLSGILLAALVFLVTLMSVSFIGASEQKIYIWVGLFWLVLTLSFEFLFGHFIVGKSWQEIIQVFNIQKGDLFIIVLFITVISPLVAAKLKGFL